MEAGATCPNTSPDCMIWVVAVRLLSGTMMVSSWLDSSCAWTPYSDSVFSSGSNKTGVSNSAISAEGGDVVTELSAEDILVPLGVLHRHLQLPCWSQSALCL